MSAQKSGSADKGFLTRLTSATAFGEGLDGYDLGAISVVLPFITKDFGLSAVQQGLIAASTLAGIFFGAPIFGYLTDRFGRRKIFILDLIAFVVIGLLQGFVTNVTQLLILRLLLGLAIGAEYAIGQTMLAEMVPREGRGRRLSSLQVAWYGGFLLSVIIAYVLHSAGLDWRWILATSAIPGLATLLLRQGLPESPRWLASQGKEDEAREIVAEHLGEDYYEDEDLGGETESETRFADLFRADMWRGTTFACVFFTCLVTPYFAIFTFAPTVFASIGIHDAKASIIGTNSVAFLGALAGMLVIEKVGRRSLLLTSFYVMVVTLAVLGIWGTAPAVILLACFAGFAFFNAVSDDLTGVYPAEIFPSELRGSGVGLAAAASRIGATAGTFLLPIGIDHFGIGPSLLAGAAICVVGLVVTHLWAPETTDLSLTKTGEADPSGRDGDGNAADSAH
ncbi:MFS transporter [Leekyejoonella antrihumi]|uniref:Sugar porter family MFS transporter n=1 Tax=Leekyejoonella antrihumi TaxID=1660198 RepID=A0A563E5U8_9MICO|nr:MFS transporter [Leekyejoonella antrihumi]TWP37938.1 sugar porter family MFS transporter [Leekyejoonella antrihumi]